MKKFIALLLALVMCLGLFAACDGNVEDPSTPAGGSIEAAKEYLHAMYKDDDGSIVRRDFTRVDVVMIGGVSYNVSWSVDSSDVTIGETVDHMVTIDINEEPAENVTFTLTATITDAEGNTETVSFTHSIEAPKKSGVEFVSAPEVGGVYKYALVQNTLGQTLYLTGNMSGYYLETTTNPFDGVDVTVEAAEGGVYLTFVKDDVKNYINVFPREDNAAKVNAGFGTEPTCVWVWDAERKTFTTTLDNGSWYIGTYNTYNTMSPSATSYIEDVTKIGDSQFPAGLCTVNIVADQVSAPVVGTAYKYALVQNTLGQTLYLTGEMSGYYLATTQNPGEAVNVYLEETTGGYHIYFVKDEVKTYINVFPREDNAAKVNAGFGAEPTCVWVWDAERKTFTTTLDNGSWYIGTYNTYNTMSPSATSYIEDVTKIGDSQFPAGVYTVDGFME